jgi:hypothetical protein
MGRNYFLFSFFVSFSFSLGGCRGQIAGVASYHDHAVSPVKTGGGGGQKNYSLAA